MAARYSREMQKYQVLKEELMGILGKGLEKSERPGLKEYVARGLKSVAYRWGVVDSMDMKLSFTPQEYHKAVEIKKEMAQLQKKMRISERYEIRRA